MGAEVSDFVGSEVVGVEVVGLEVVGVRVVGLEVVGVEVVGVEVGEILDWLGKVIVKTRKKFMQACKARMQRIGNLQWAPT